MAVAVQALGDLTLHMDVVQKIEPESEAGKSAPRERDLKALASLIDFAIYSAEAAETPEALAYLRVAGEIVRATIDRNAGATA